MQLKSLVDCRLKIGRYPTFYYNATGGGGITTADYQDNKGNLFFRFNPNSFSIPSLNWQTTKFLGLVLLPGLEINIVPKIIKGNINIHSGLVSLQLEAKFILSIFSLIKAPELVVKTELTSTNIKGDIHEAIGSPINNRGETILVGLATIEPSGNRFLDSFLSLPNEALAILHCEFTNFKTN